MKGKVLYFSVSLIVMFSMVMGLTASTAQSPSPTEQPEVDLGEPGLSYRYEQTYGTLQVPYIADPDYLNSPVGLFIDDSDNLYVTEEWGFRVLEYDPTPTISMTLGIAGHPAWKFGGNNLLNGPHDVALDNSGNIWVADANRVVQFDPSGVYLQQLLGDGITYFADVEGIAFDSEERMFVTDPYNHRVQVYDLTSGTPVYSTTLGIPGECGADDTHFCYPWRVALDSLDQLYVADSDNGRVQKCTYSSGWSCALFDSGLFRPRGITVDGSDNVFISDTETENNRIRKCISGICDDFATDTPGFKDLAVDSAGNVYGAIPWDVYTVYQYDSTGLWFNPEYIGHAGVPYPADVNHYNIPLVSTDAEDNILITEEWGHRLIKLDPDGNLLWTFGEAGVSGWDNEHFNSPMRVAADSSGNIYVPEGWNSRIQIISPDGNYLNTVGAPGDGELQFNGPLGVAIGSNGFIYVADGENQRVQILDISTPITPTYVATIGVTGDCQIDNDHLCHPSSVALDTAGNIYIADSGNHRVQKFDSNFVYQMTIGTGVPGNQFDQLNWPEDVVVDAQGKIFVSDGNNLRVQVFDSSGAYLTTIGGASGTGSSQFLNAGSVAIDSAGNVYVSDNGNSRIQKYSPGVPDWKQVNINGFGNPATLMVTIRPFNGQLYAGAGDWTYGVQVWRTADGTTWNMVTTPGEGLGVFSGVILGMIEFGGKLYVGTGWGGSPPEIWRTSNGTDWEQVMVSTNGDAASVSAFAVFENKLYVALPDGSENGGVAIYRSSSGDEGSWLPNVTHGGGDVHNINIFDFAGFNNQLYAVGANTNTGAFIWRYDGSTWTQVNTPGFDDTTQNNAQSIAVFNNTLYVGTFCYPPLCTAGYEGAIYKSINGTDWSLVVTGFEQAGYGDVTSLYPFDGALFAAVAGRSEGNTIWRTMDGTSWQQVNISGWGDSNNDFSMCDYAITSFNNQLYVGTTNYSNGTSDITSNLANGTEIWRYEPKVTASFSATPTEGIAPLEVTFTNTSTGTLTANLWDFGDGFTSSLTSPVHTYTAAGVYTVTLTVDSFGNLDTITKANLITVENRKFFLPVIRR